MGQLIKTTNTMRDGVRVRVSHTSVTLPESVAGMTDKPLYQVVAQWGLLLDRTFTTEEVAEVFGLSRQKARDVLSYIYHDGRDWIFSERKMGMNRLGRPVVRHWRITGIEMQTIASPGSRARKRK